MPFEESDMKEVNELVGQGVFNFELYNPIKYNNNYIFKAYIVREVKGKIIKPYEKSRLIIQGYND